MARNPNHAMKYETLHSKIANLTEAEQAAGRPLRTLEALRQAGYRIVRERDGDRYFLAHKNELQPLLVKLGEIASVKGYIHDNNTGDRFPKSSFLRSLKDAQCIKLNQGSPGVIEYGVAEQGESRLIAPLLFARTFGDRLFILYNVGCILAKEFYKIIPKDKQCELLLAATTNCTWFLMQMELQGSVGLGGGALKFNAKSICFFLIPTTEELIRHNNAILSAFHRLSQRPIRSIFEELGYPKPNRDYSNIDPDALTLEQVKQASPDRYELDSILFDVLGLTEEERLAVYRAVVQLVKDRLVKAKSV
jgi:hypothetical protein